MEATDGQDLCAQLISLRRRVEELERENERLVLRVLSCRCSKHRMRNGVPNWISELLMAARIKNV